MDNILSASINEHEFGNTDDLEDKVDTFFPIAQLLNADGRVNTPSILHRASLPTPEFPTLKEEEHLLSSHATAEHGHKMAGVSVEDVDGLRCQIPLPMSTLKKTTKLSFVDDTVHLKDNLIMDHTTTGARTMLHCDGNKPPTSTKQPFFKGTTSRSLFRSAPPLLTPIVPLAPFEKWGIDFISPINPVSAWKNRYIILATDYATKWVEARSMKWNDAATTTAFLFEEIMMRFGHPLEMISDRGKHFLNDVITTSLLDI